MLSLVEKIEHVLYGIAYGDALGMPTENMTQAEIKQRYGRVTTFLSSPADGPLNRGLVAGQITDDTANSVFVSKMLVATQGQVDRQVFVDYLMDWLAHDPTSTQVTGPSTFRAVEAIKKGTPLAEAGKLGTTNGAAMKIGPMGLITSYRDLPALVQQVAEICVPTHNTQVAIQGAAVVATAVSYLFENEKADWDEFYALLAQTVTLSAPYGNQLPTPDMGQRLTYSRQLADQLPEAAFLKQLYEFLGTGLPTIETVPAAIALVYRYRGNLTQAVEAAANVGGDTDTVGAICGAICGGYQYNLAPAMAQQLADVNQLGLEQLAQQLAPIVEKGL